MSLKTIINSNKHKVKKLQKIVDQVESYADHYSAMSDEELQDETARFKAELANGATLDSLLPEAFAAVREADKRVLGLYPYPVQIMGGIVLHQGNLAEMRTGEGKTLTETMPTYLNALTGKGVHVITVNDYLSKRDFEEMGPVFQFMGMTVGQNGDDMDLESKKAAYACDITYSTNDALAFDYLRDNMAYFKQDQVQRGLNYVIVDEVDSILIDEARTPLIISGNEKSYKTMYRQADEIAKRMTKDDYVYDPENRTITLNRSGVLKANEGLGVKNVFGTKAFTLAHYLDEALKANFTMERDKDYIVQDGHVVIVDTNTGRVMPDRQFSDGLHQALEAKEGVEIQEANRTEATITYQNFFRMYDKLSGMSGTASTESDEFYHTFGMQVVTIPTNKPVARIDLPDELFVTQRAKFRAAIELIQKVHKTREPILVGTASVAHSELLSNMLDDKGIPHAVLNAKNNEKEAQIIAQAGQAGAITIATNMAGRGTDIKLGPGVKELGGLFVLGTERHESRRIDNQLRGRAGRQGDPGITIFYMSLEDDLIERFGGDQIRERKEKLVKEGKEFERLGHNRTFNHVVTNAQKKVEGNNYDQRKNTLRYDDVINEQRKDIYAQRQETINAEGDTLNKVMLAIFNRTIKRTVDKFYLDSQHIHYDGLVVAARDILNVDLNPDATQEEYDTTTRDEKYKRNLLRYIQENERLNRISLDEVKKLDKTQLENYLYDQVKKGFQSIQEALVSEKDLRDFEKIVILKQVDTNWKDHIVRMEQLRQSITLRGYGSYNPLVEYQGRAFTVYEDMIKDIERDVTKNFLSTEVRQEIKEGD